MISDVAVLTIYNVNSLPSYSKIMWYEEVSLKQQLEIFKFFNIFL